MGVGLPGRGRDREDDGALAQLAAQGDAEAFTRLVQRHRRLIDAGCASSCVGLPSREDAVQMALVDIWRGLPGWTGDSAVTTWMYRVARNAGHRHRRQLGTQRFGPAIEGDGGPGEPVEPGSWDDAIVTRDAVLEAVRSLPDDHREALLMFSQGGLTIAEIAAVMFAAEGTVKSWISRARAEVARQLEASR